MNIKNIIVFKETRPTEMRVALSPAAVNLFIEKGFTVLVEADAGIAAGFTNNMYTESGAKLFQLGPDLLPSHSLLLRVKRPLNERENIENALIASPSIMIGFLDPFDVDHEGHIDRLRTQGVMPISLELFELPSNDPRSPQSAMSRFAGRLALEDALRHYEGKQAVKISIFGPGSAGLSAAIAAKSRKFPVQLFGRKESYRKQVESTGAEYKVLPKVNQRQYIQAALKDQTIIVTAVRTAGCTPAPIIDAAVIPSLPENSVIIDLSTGEGGSVLGSKSDLVVESERGIKIINVSGYPKTEHHEASKAFSNSLVNLLDTLLTAEKRLVIPTEIYKPLAC